MGGGQSIGIGACAGERRGQELPGPGDRGRVCARALTARRGGKRGASTFFLSLSRPGLARGRGRNAGAPARAPLTDGPWVEAACAAGRGWARVERGRGEPWPIGLKRLRMWG